LTKSFLEQPELNLQRSIESFLKTTPTSHLQTETQEDADPVDENKDEEEEEEEARVVKFSAKEEKLLINEGCLLISTFPSKIQFWRRFYCPNEFSPVGEEQSKQEEIKRLISENALHQQVFFLLPSLPPPSFLTWLLPGIQELDHLEDILDPERVRKRKEEEAKKKKKQAETSKSPSSYDIDCVNSLEDISTHPED